MRTAFADELTRLIDPRVVLLTGDIGNQLFDTFREAHPDRFYNCGVAEQNMTGVAAGMAMTGMRPITYTIAPFVTTRCLEQIRTDVCYHDLPVMIVAVGGGMSYANLGPTHHACEDIAFLRAIPNIAVVCPGDAWEVRAAMRAALERDHPTYIRLGKRGEPKVHAEVPGDFRLGIALPVRLGSDISLLSTGTMLPVAMDTAHLLAARGVSAEVVSFHTVKPLDGEFLARAFSRFRLIATMEEHSLIGGFGAAVAEWVVDNAVTPRGFLRFGTPDRFFTQSGGHAYAREQLGLSAPFIAERILAQLT